MARPAISGFSVLRAALLGTTALVLLGPGIALARVGVTSATDGDPRGKPPQEAERILRIGIDVQANEAITTGANDRAHLVFLDGTSLTVGPNAQLTIDKFVYDPDTKTGELAVNASKGVLRLVGGKISKTNPITITTPSSTIGIRGGISILNVQPTETTATFVFGDKMTVSGNGHTENVTRHGSQIRTILGALPNKPVLAPQGSLTGAMSQLEGTGGGSSGNSTGGGQGNQSNNNSGGGNADQGARDFGRGNSGQGPSSGPPPGPLGPGGPNNPNNNNINANILPGANQQQQDQQKGNTSTGPTFTTRLIVSRGRLLVEPAFTAPNTFGPTNQTVTANAANNQELIPIGVVTTQNGTNQSSLIVGSAGSPTQAIQAPWQQGVSGFNADTSNTSFGPLTGLGYVSAQGDAFAYVFKDQNNKTLGFVGGTPTPNSDLPSTGFAAYALHNLTPNGLTTLPFATDTIASNFTGANATVSTSPLYAVYAYNASTAIVSGQSVPTANSGQLQATLAISGVYAGGTPAQSSYMGVYINQFVPETSNGSVAASGVFGGTYRLNAAQTSAGYLQSAESTADTGAGNAIYGTAAKGDAAAFMVFTPDQVNLNVTGNGTSTVVTGNRSTQAALDQTLSVNNNNLVFNNASYYSVAAAVQQSNPSSLGVSRTSQIVTGFVDGLVDSTSAGGVTTTRVIGGVGSDSATIGLLTSPSTNSVAAIITTKSWSGVSGATANFVLGGLGLDAGSLFVDDGTYAARDTNASFVTKTVTVGNSTTTTTTAPGDINSSTVLVSQGVAPVTTFLLQSGLATVGTTGNSTTTPICECKYLTWGWWGGSVTYASTQTGGVNINPGGIDNIHMATYVAGNQSLSGQVDTTSTVTINNQQQSSATYYGQMIGNVNNNGQSYIAAGTYQNAWSFGAGRGSLAVTFDGASFSGSTSLTPGTSNFSSGNITTSGGSGRTLNLNGSFFNGNNAATTALYQAGRFGVTGSSYTAAGTFAAQRPQ